MATYLARGNVALSVSLAVATTLACVVTTPLLFGVLAGAHLPAQFEMPVGQIAFDVVAHLFVPLAVGMALGVRCPDRREAMTRWSVISSFVLLATIWGSAMGSGRASASGEGMSLFAIVIVIAIYAVGVFAIGVMTARAARLPLRDAITIGLESNYRNLNLGFLIKASALPSVVGEPEPLGGAPLFVFLVYGPLSFVVVAAVVPWHRRRAGPPPES